MFTENFSRLFAGHYVETGAFFKEAEGGSLASLSGNQALLSQAYL